MNRDKSTNSQETQADAPKRHLTVEEVIMDMKRRRDTYAAFDKERARREEDEPPPSSNGG